LEHFESGEIRVAYEAGPCGFGLHDQLREDGVEVMVPMKKPSRIAGSWPKIYSFIGFRYPSFLKLWAIFIGKAIFFFWGGMASCSHEIQCWVKHFSFDGSVSTVLSSAILFEIWKV